MIDQNFDPISDTIYVVDTISQLPVSQDILKAHSKVHRHNKHRKMENFWSQS